MMTDLTGIAETAPPPADIGTADGRDLPHLGGPAAAVRQVLAAHFVRDCAHVVEIGGHLRPITPYLTHRPESVLVVDPKVEPLDFDSLNGAPCRGRHVARKFQEIDYDLPPGSYGLVLLGLSLKPFGRQDPLGPKLFALVDNAKVVVIDYPPRLDRANRLVPHILARDSVRLRCSIDMRLHDGMIEGSPYAERRFLVLEPATTSAPPPHG